jgi:hypothetical protein
MAPPLGPQGWVWRGLETQEGAEATSEHTSVQSSNHRQVSSVDSRQGQPRHALDRSTGLGLVILIERNRAS